MPPRTICLARPTTLFADFLDALRTGSGVELGEALATFARAVAAFQDGLPPNPEAWRGVTWGLMEGYRNWKAETAALAYDEAARMLRGEFARVNYSARETPLDVQELVTRHLKKRGLNVEWYAHRLKRSFGEQQCSQETQ